MNAETLVIEISNQQSLPVDERPLVDIARQILVDHNVSCGELSIAIVDDPTIQKLNKQYLSHDYETDVISFVLDEDESIGRMDGQLIVSTDTAKRESVDAGWSFEAELLLYVVHGTLHLVGYDDKHAAAIPEMRSAEAEYMAKLGFPVPAEKPANQKPENQKP